MRTGLSVAFLRAGEPLEIRRGPVPDPEPGGVLVRVAVAGVCGTDAHRMAGDVPGPDHPISLGHEGIGIIDTTGAAVVSDWAGQGVRAGDRIYWSAASCCNRCWACTVEHDCSSCREHVWPEPADRPSRAAFREFATLGATVPFYRVPDDTPSEAVIAFGCAMPTALSGLDRLGGIAAGQTVVIQGSGPVGLSATMLCALSAAAQVIVIGAPDHRLRVATRLGATETISLDTTTREQRHQRVLELTGGRGADAVIEAAGQLAAFDEGLGLLARNGRYLILGLYSGTGTVPVDPVRINNLNLRLVGSLGFQPSDLLHTIELAQRHHRRLALGALVTHRFPLAETTEAIRCMATGEAIKAVVTP